MENIGLANVFHEFWDFWKTINSWKTLARPRASIVFSQEFMEYIGQANIFNEFWGFIRPALKAIGGP